MRRRGDYDAARNAGRIVDITPRHVSTRASRRNVARLIVIATLRHDAGNLRQRWLRDRFVVARRICTGHRYGARRLFSFDVSNGVHPDADRALIASHTGVRACGSRCRRPAAATRVIGTRLWSPAVGAIQVDVDNIHHLHDACYFAADSNTVLLGKWHDSTNTSAEGRQQAP